LRRLAAARGLLGALTVVSAVSLGSLVYAETFAASLANTTTEKAYMAIGSDANATIDQSQQLPARFPYPLTKVEWGNGAADANGSDGEQVDVITINPKTFPRALHWQSDWGTNPDDLLGELTSAPSLPMP